MRKCHFEVIAKTNLVKGNKVTFVAATEVEDFCDSHDAERVLRKNLLKDNVFGSVDDFHMFLIPEERYNEYQKCEWMTINAAREELIEGIQEREAARKVEDKKNNRNNIMEILRYGVYMAVYIALLIDKIQTESVFWMMFSGFFIIFCGIEIVSRIIKVVKYYKKAVKEHKKQMILAR